MWTSAVKWGQVCNLQVSYMLTYTFGAHVYVINRKAMEALPLVTFYMGPLPNLLPPTGAIGATLETDEQFVT